MMDQSIYLNLRQADKMFLPLVIKYLEISK
jgi:hypothetical protein